MRVDQQINNAEKEWQRTAEPGAGECPQCGAILYPEDCGALDSCEKCGWLGKLTRATAVVLFWWFLLFGGSRPVVVGPFANQKLCEEIREEIPSETHRSTSCWSDTARPVGPHNGE